jgi:hypothetical protein
LLIGEEEKVRPDERGGLPDLNRIIEWGDRELGEFLERGDRELGEFFQSVREKVMPEGPEASEGTRTLEVMPEEVKRLYVRVLVAQTFVGDGPAPKQVADIYVFMSRIGLSSDSRSEVRQLLANGGMRAKDTVGLAEDLISQVKDDERDMVAFSIIKDMTWISGSDDIMTPDERERIQAVADALVDEPEKVMALADDALEYDATILQGDVKMSELEEHGKRIAASAAAIGIPVAAIYFSGSVVGLSAAGIVSGLATLGLGGVLGLSAMVTGIGVIVLIGAATFVGARWLMGGREREFAKKREYLIQEVLKRHQKAIEDLALDISEIAARMEEYVLNSDRNAADLRRLKDELRVFRSALQALRDKKQGIEDIEGLYATS